jgi:hypothetical protein
MRPLPLKEGLHCDVTRAAVDFADRTPASLWLAGAVHALWGRAGQFYSACVDGDGAEQGGRTGAVQIHALGGKIKNKDSELYQLCKIHSKRSTKPRFDTYHNYRKSLTSFLSAGF